MPLPIPEAENASIVLIGRFNPAIFHPEWFRRHDLLPEEEIKAAEEQKNAVLTHSEVAVFQTGWLRLQVLPDRFEASTTRMDMLDPLRDLLIGVFSLLAHTPARVMGINRQSHFSLPSADEWLRIMGRFSPLDAWNQVLTAPKHSEVVVVGERPAPFAFIRVRLLPSAQPKLSTGILIDTNQHVEVIENDSDPPLRALLDVLGKEYKPAMQHALSCMQSILT